MVSQYKQSKHISLRCSRIPNNVHLAFTIVELLVVIVVIAILAAITIVSYTNITARANTSSVKSTLSQAIKGLEAYKEGISTTETYPSAAAFSVLNIAKNSNNIAYTYYPSDTSDTPSSYCLEGTTNNTTFSISSTNEVVVNKPCTENSLVGWWKLNGDATDSSGNGNNGNVYGATAAAGEDGITSHAMSFDGVDDSINIARKTILEPNTFTVSVWVKFEGLDYTNGAGKLNGLLSKGNPDMTPGVSSSGWWFSYDNRNNKSSFVYTCFGNIYGGYAGGGNSFDSYNQQFENGQYYLMTITATSSEARLFINGIQKGSTRLLYNTALANPVMNLAIGTLGGSHFINGSLDDARIYNRALSADEILRIYEDGAQ